MTVRVATATRSDEQIQRDVLAELKWDARLQPNGIGVSVKEGVVILTGWVESYQKKWAAEQAAKRVEGVSAVVNEIHFDTSFRGRQRMSRILNPGTIAPDFTLRVTPDQNLTLSELRGQPAVLAFYPADWSPVCSDQMALYNEILPEFQTHRAELIGTSVEGVWCHAALAKDRRLHFPLLADFEPKGAVAKKYGAYRESEGVCERALFVLDSEGTIFWSYCSPIAVNPGADGILEALEELSKQESSHGRVESTSHSK